jgi:hypothetical protein
MALRAFSIPSHLALNCVHSSRVGVRCFGGITSPALMIMKTDASPENRARRVGLAVAKEWRLFLNIRIVYVLY